MSNVNATPSTTRWAIPAPLLWTAGVPRHLRAGIPQFERWQHGMEGLGLWITAGFAFLAALFAAQRLVPGMNPIVCAGIAVAWLVVIFVLDRSVLLTLQAARTAQLTQVTLRIGIAVLSSWLVSEQLVLRIFSDRLERVRLETELHRNVDDQLRLRQVHGLDALEGGERAHVGALQSLDQRLKQRPQSVLDLDAEAARLGQELIAAQERAATQTTLLSQRIVALERQRAGHWRAAQALQAQALDPDRERYLARARGQEIAQLQAEIGRVKAALTPIRTQAQSAQQAADDAWRAYRRQIETERESVRTELNANRALLGDARANLGADSSRFQAGTERAFAANWIAENEALIALEAQSPSTRLLRYRLQALFLLIELLPVLMVLTRGRGTLNDALHAEQSELRSALAMRAAEADSAAQIEAQGARDAVLGYAAMSASNHYQHWQQAAAMRLHAEAAQGRIKLAESAMLLDMDLATTLGNRWAQDQEHLNQLVRAHPNLAQALSDLFIRACVDSVQTQRAVMQQLSLDLAALRQGAGS